MALKKNKIYALMDDKKGVAQATGIFELFVDETISGNKITQEIIGQLEADDTLLVQNILYLGGSVSDVAATLGKLAQAQINLCLVDENLSFKADKLSELADSLLVALKIHNSLISLRSKDALQKRKAGGMRLGRPFEANPSLKLDDYKDEILTMIKSGVSKDVIAQKYHVCRSTVYNFVRRQELTEAL